jgi:hypothetical protein
MEKGIGGVIALLIGVGILFGVRFYNKGDTGQKLLYEAKAFVAEADKYDEFREYFDWLVETAHEDVFNDSYHMGMGRRSRSWVDTDKYSEDLFNRMIELARENDYPDVADSLERLIDPDAEERQLAEKAERKKTRK